MVLERKLEALVTGIRGSCISLGNVDLVWILLGVPWRQPVRLYPSTFYTDDAPSGCEHLIELKVCLSISRVLDLVSLSTLALALLHNPLHLLLPTSPLPLSQVLCLLATSCRLLLLFLEGSYQCRFVCKVRNLLAGLRLLYNLLVFLHARLHLVLLYNAFPVLPL